MSYKKRELKLKILMVDENKNICRAVALSLKNTRCSLLGTDSASKALTYLESGGLFDLALIDFTMNNKEDQKLITSIKKKYPEMLIGVMTTDLSVENAVKEVGEMALGYLSKPLTKNYFFHFLGQAQTIIQLKKENLKLHMMKTKISPSAVKKNVAQFTSKTIENDPVYRTLEEVERRHILRLLSKEPNLERATRILGITKATLWRKRKEYGLI